MTVLDLVARLRSEGSKLSRNRNFDLFEDKNARRALRLHKMLRKLERDLIRYARRKAQIHVKKSHKQSQPKTVIEVHDPSIRLKRKIFLDQRELVLLCERPELEQLLAPALKKTQ